MIHINKETPKETVVPDEFIKHYPEPPEKLQNLLKRVPNTNIEIPEN